ncbi:MAG TPA: alcohol dehydrogenase catalytic domain-containing protein [Methylomirabilota bacterium]|jgi:L-iditol 2-dehydrogenase|nr:alcohol dehydrogenase catalytic domain-containing protein [Methylomirabilota bacterium]
MRAAVFHGAGRLAAEDWPRPAIGDGELLLRVRGCGLCGSDIAKIVAAGTRGPAVFGHEVVGDVIEAGAGAAGFMRGDRVVAAHHVPCGECHYCRRGSESMCRAFKASNLDPGGFAEYVRVPAPNVRHATFRVPEHISDEEASFVEPLACCLRAVERARVEPGDTAVVIGLGSIGCLFVQLLARAGASVVGFDHLAQRARLAQTLGAAVATTTEDAAAATRLLSDGRGADHVIVTGGGAAVLPPAAALARDGGSIHYFAGGEGEALPLPLETLYHRELTLTTTYSSSPATLARAFWLIAAGKVAVDRLITHRLPLERLAEGVDLMRRRQALKVWVTP